MVAEQMSADIDEKAIRDADPQKLVLKLAQAKANALLNRIDYPALLITADQVVVCNGEIREKPESREEAMKFLVSYTDHPAEIINGVMVTNTVTKKSAFGIDLASVFYNKSLIDEIEKIVENPFVMKAAGGLLAEKSMMIVHEREHNSVDGSFLGMPIELLKRLIAEVQ